MWTQIRKHVVKVKKNGVFLRKRRFFIGPSGETQTRGLTLPKRPFYQLNYTRIYIKYHTRKNRKSNFIVVKIVAKAMQLGTFDFLKSHKSPVAQGFPGFLKNYLNIIQQRPKEEFNRFCCEKLHF